MLNFSFWADEAYVSGIAKQFSEGKLLFSDAINFPGITYQKLHMLILSAFFKIFGVSELTSRLPSMIAFGLGIVVIFLLVKKLSNVYGGLVSGFLYAFSHLNLSYATQAKPYSFIETITLFVLLLITHLKNEKSKRMILVLNLIIILSLVTATFLHSIGVMLWIVYLMFLLLRYNLLKNLNPKNIIIIIAIFVISLIFTLPTILIFFNSGKIFSHNHSYQLFKLFGYKYFFISLLSLVGFIWQFKKNRAISISLIAFSLVTLLMATFEIYIFNIRYVLSLFGILFLFFGVFWAKVGEKYDEKFKVIKFKGFKVTGKAVIPIVVIIILYAIGYKIVRWPQAYYSPNIDKYGDVQIANYKDFYARLKDRFPNYKDLYVVNDTFDVEYWYFGRYSNAYFMKFTEKPTKHSVVNAYVYGSIKEFKEIIKKHPKGLLIMEDWESFLPEDIKQYAKKNLRQEFRVESLKEAPDDPWPLALYSWGLP